MMKTTLILVAALLGACSGKDGPKQGGQSPTTDQHEGPHGGHVVEIGAHVAHLEVLHDEDAGKMTIYVLGPDAKTAMAVAKAPQLKLQTAAGPKVLETKAQNATAGKSSMFVATDDLLKAEPQGRISIEIGGKVYNPDIEHDHDH